LCFMHGEQAKAAALTRQAFAVSTAAVTKVQAKFNSTGEYVSALALASPCVFIPSRTSSMSHVILYCARCPPQTQATEGRFRQGQSAAIGTVLHSGRRDEGCVAVPHVFPG
jgi:hypothetical protein